MKLCLVFMFTPDELPYLKLHLPVFAHEFDGIWAMTDYSTPHEVIHEVQALCGAGVSVAKWEYNWGDFVNKLVRHPEVMGFDAVMRIDPDECLMPGAADEIRRLLTDTASLLVLPRYEFFGDRRHYRADLYPDGQARAWRLNRGIIVQGLRHEGVDLTAHGLSEHDPHPDHYVLRGGPHIYHYGWIGKTGIYRNMVKYQRHAQVSAGGPEHVAFPADTPLVSFPTVPFDGPQPIDPDTVGLYAPFEE